MKSINGLDVVSLTYIAYVWEGEHTAGLFKYNSWKGDTICRSDRHISSQRSKGHDEYTWLLDAVSLTQMLSPWLKLHMYGRESTLQGYLNIINDTAGL